VLFLNVSYTDSSRGGQGSVSPLWLSWLFLLFFGIVDYNRYGFCVAVDGMGGGKLVACCNMFVIVSAPGLPVFPFVSKSFTDRYLSGFDLLTFCIYSKFVLGILFV
jgi:hypothetical protein